MFAMIYCTLLVVLSLFLTFPFYYSSKVTLIRNASLFFLMEFMYLLKSAQHGPYIMAIT